jgi:hypothetical protein
VSADAAPAPERRERGIFAERYFVRNSVIGVTCAVSAA